MTDPGPVRASDTERDLAAGELRDHFAAGRLSADELSERLDTVFGARTTADLARVNEDLPSLPRSPARQRAELAQRPAQLRRELVQQTGGSLRVFVLCVVIWAVSGADGEFWPAWVVIFPLIALLRNGWRLYAPAPELDRVEAELARGRHRPGRRQHRRPSRRLGLGDGKPA